MSKKITNEDIEKAVVSLKPLFGISPGVYLTVIYGFLLLIVLFFLLFFPGIMNNGTIVYIETLPAEAVVYVNDIYMGSTPVEIFIPKGKKEIKIEKKYFDTIFVNESIKGRIFGSLIFPLKTTIANNMILNNKNQFLADRFKQLSSFALIEDYYDRYQMPPLISKTVTEYSAATNGNNNDLLYDFLYSMRVNLGSPEMVTDYINAINLVSSENISDESIDFSTIFNFFSKENNSNELVLSILEAYPSQKRRDIIDLLNEDYDIDNILGNMSNKKFTDLMEPSFPGNSFTFENLTFIAVKGGSYMAGTRPQSESGIIPDNYSLNNFPHTESITDFFILEKEITRKDFALFLEENPEWNSENIEYLVENKLVTYDYLKNQDFFKPEIPVSNISWYAANAYTEWLETKLPGNMSGYEIRLPSEAQWEAAAWLNENSSTVHITRETEVSGPKAVDSSRAGYGGLYDVMGNLWEWTDTWYFPGDTVNGSFGLNSDNWEGVEKAVRGGSWGNGISDVNIPTRGSQAPNWCTPFTGFRPILVKK